jgi:GNAT superfamily N-acetyltransferase
MTVSIRALASEEHDAASVLLADAFFDNPAHAYILPDEATRRRRLHWWMRRNLAIQAALGLGYGVSGSQPGSPLEALNFWHRPDANEASVALLLRHGFLLAPFHVGASGLRRLLEVTKHIEAKRREALAGRPAWYLQNMVVRKEIRGEGLGRRFLGEQLAGLVDPGREVAVLATQQPANVRFYEQLGFEVAIESAIGERRNTRFLNWIMLRPPAG